MGNQRRGTAASYRDHISSKNATEPLFNFKAPSGFVFVLRKPDLKPWIVSGELPLDLVAEVATSIGHGGKAAVDAAKSELEKKQISKQDEAAMLIFMREVVQAAAVKPRIEPSAKDEDEDALHPKHIEWDDFMSIFYWAVSGGGEADSLKTFLSGQSKDVNGRTGGTGRRNKGKRASLH